ncbi:molybdopterin synthase [Halovivax sp.]|uniref:molybdopterin synthase n=1 Tax=Halovivax sp. TaxID=1935978 RepID=UPI0025BD97D1|nr:molybdopterin synthase [Halovivax sp.]
MHVLGITDHDSPPDALDAAVDRVVDRLSREGRVGVVRYDATIADGTAAFPDRVPAGGDVTYELGADGDWAATGTGMRVEDALASLADRCDYAVLVGVETARFPTVVVGSAGAADANPGRRPEPIAAVETAADLDLDAVVGELEGAEPYETLDSLVARVKRSPRADRAGAIATFTGRVRAKDDPDDARTEYLEFEKYEGVADERMAAIRSELEARDGVYEVALHHRTGVVRDGEDIVFVVVLAGHRAEAFRTVEDGINRLKDEVPLFKKEVTVEDEFWVHDRP